MGRQVLFHMLSRDCQDFLAHVTQHASVWPIERDSDSSKVEPVRSPCSLGQVIILWNKDLLPVLKRKHIPKSIKGPYYRVDSSLPVVELSIPREADWEGLPSLTQGRIYASFDYPNRDLNEWFDSMSKWIRKNFSKNPVGLTSGYVGPAALKWFQAGGILLPFVRPISSPYWISFVNAQHRNANIKT